MEIIKSSFLAGLLGFLTPAVFPFSYVFLMVFERFGDHKKQHEFNFLLFSIVVLLFSTICFSNLFLNEINSSKKILTSITNGILLSELFLLLAFLLSFTNYFRNILKIKIAVYFCLTILGIHLSIASLSNMGPIIGTLIINNDVNDSIYLMKSFFFFSFGLLIPFAIIYFFVAKFFERLRKKSWWKVLQIIIASLLFINISMLLSNVL